LTGITSEGVETAGEDVLEEVEEEEDEFKEGDLSDPSFIRFQFPEEEGDFKSESSKTMPDSRFFFFCCFSFS